MKSVICRETEITKRHRPIRQLVGLLLSVCFGVLWCVRASPHSFSGFCSYSHSISHHWSIDRGRPECLSEIRSHNNLLYDIQPKKHVAFSLVVNELTQCHTTNNKKLTICKVSFFSDTKDKLHDRWWKKRHRNIWNSQQSGKFRLRFCLFTLTCPVYVQLFDLQWFSICFYSFADRSRFCLDCNVLIRFRFFFHTFMNGYISIGLE